MRTVQYCCFVVLFILLFSCGKSDKQLAADRIKLAQTIYSQGDTSRAIAHLDSVKKLYPGAIQAIVNAGQIQKNIWSEILFRKQIEMDSVMAGIRRLEGKFDQEKTEYDRYTQYIPKRQGFEGRWNKSFLQMHLDEKGELYISSNYYGTEPLDHTGIRIYDEEIQAKTATIDLDNPDNYRSEFMGLVSERVSYRKGKDQGVIEFIAQHRARPLKAVFLGKRQYFIILEDFDKQAAKDALEMSRLLRKKLTLLKEIKTLQSKAG